MPFDDVPMERKLPSSLENPSYQALNNHLLKTRGYGYQTFFGKKTVLEIKIANGKRELTRIGISEQEKEHHKEEIALAEEGLKRLFEDEEIQRLWKDFQKENPLSFDK